MWLLCHALDEDHSLSPYHRLLRTCMKVFKLDKNCDEFHMMMT